MDPLKTLVKYSLMPLRVLVQLGDLYVGGDEQPQAAPAPPPEPAPAAAKPRRKPQTSKRPKPIGDPAIARKVESAIFRDEDVPKGDINVNVVDGVAYLRGEAKSPEMINALEEQAKAVTEVVGVENLLHLPGTPAPTRTDTPPSQRKSRRTKPHSSIVGDRPVEQRVTEERAPTTAGSSNGAEKPL
jgi:hypothetical protein